MPDTVLQVIQDAQASLPDLMQTRAVRLMQKVYQDILAQIPELQRGSSTLALTAGQYEYALSEINFQVDQAFFVPAGAAAGTGILLGNTNTEYLYKMDPAWRERGPTNWAAADQPSIDFYITNGTISGSNGLIIGFNYPPDSTAATGVLTLYASQNLMPTLTTGSVLPAGLISSQVFCELLLWYAAREIRPSMVNAFWATFQYQLAMTKEFIRTRNEGLKKPLVRNIRSSGNEYPSDAEVGQGGGAPQ
jgi:hypothetical protein